MSGWGEPKDLMDPVYATNAFLDRLIKLPNWETLPADDIIAMVQGYYDPEVYANWLATAESLTPTG